MTPSRTPGAQDVAPIERAHATAEAVYTLAPPIVRLKSSLHTL